MTTQEYPSSYYYMDGGRPFFIRGSEVGCLCLHGLTALPQEVYWLGQKMAEQSCTVYGPRLAGHGSDWRDLAHMNWQDWYGSALDAYHVLRQQCSQVFVMGLSLGSILSLQLGIHEDVAGVIAIATFVELDMPVHRANLLKYVMRHTKPGRDDNHLRVDARMRELQAARGEYITGRTSYDRFPTHSLHQLHILMEKTRRELPELTAPLLLIHSEGDQTVPFRNQEIIAALAGTPPDDLHKMRVTDSDHLITLDVDMDDVFTTAVDFVARYAG